ncbi:hypothetical protein DH2020_031230 [Rehmannia glutinosa]|uniref:ZF-HD dimerization-type domain-containing protein n=1 Tax=Rehmannia glutinosa TaxID=99300 RepID=A0ABR0VK72_REHGL
MDYEDQDEEQEGEIGSGPSYNDPTRNKTPTSSEAAAAAPLRKHRYKECLKNHAVGIGGHAVDGCGEFISAGDDGTLESLKCAACNCHRNFHRKENDSAAYGGAFHHQQQQLLLTHHPHHGHHFGYRNPGAYIHAPPRAAALLALPPASGGGGGAASRDDMEDYYYNSSNPGGSGKKRFRTKFSQDQKDKMLDFAERLGWRIQKQSEETVEKFCNELGIKRHVLKVWMHNNKHTLGKKTLGDEKMEL